MIGNTPYPQLDTPVVLLDMDKLEANIKEMSQLAADACVRLRPHTKVHECGYIARLQVEAGACGIEVGNVDQAECMAEEGIDDILIAHPFCGELKLEKLKKLLINKPKVKISVVVDMIEQAEGISRIGQAVAKRIPVHLKIDTGVNRYGILPGEPALYLAKKLNHLPGVELVGIYTHESGAEPTADGIDRMAFKVASTMADTARMLRREGLSVEVVSVGASPTFRATCHYLKRGIFPEISEIHPGAAIIGDIMYMRALGITAEACALTVLTTVMSTSHPGHAVIDAGYKTFGAESLIAHRNTPGFFWKGMPNFGSIQGRPELWFGRLAAETGWIYYKNADQKLNLGERLEIVPTNATLVINIHSKVYGVRNNVVEKVIQVSGRGRGN
jgi:D-serine deaminase-like pyridoxal phosphate-dependent protein